MGNKSTQNLHLEHPEDSILTGDLSVLNWFSECNSTISVKMDGSPALVWGTHPENGKFFVCTKSAFNKKKVRICYTENDVLIHFGHQERVAQILLACLKYLPRTDNVYQGDWIGFGDGNDTFTPNTITYKFPESVDQKIIIAPHTYYLGMQMSEMVAFPILHSFESTEDCLFVQPNVSLKSYREDLYDVCQFAKQMSTICTFVSEKDAEKIKKEINRNIRENKEIDENEIAEVCECDVNVIRLWKLVASIKSDLFMFIHEEDEIECSINGTASFHEGYVIHNEFGSFKVVDRQEFSRLNFILPKTW